MTDKPPPYNPSAAQGHPPPQQGYPAPQPQPGYPPQPQPGYPPQPQHGYPAQPGYAPQPGGYPPQQMGYPPQQMGYPPQQMGYAPQPQTNMMANNTVVVTAPAVQQGTVIVTHRERPRVNHLLHFIITLFFWPWVFVWIILCITEGA